MIIKFPAAKQFVVLLAVAAMIVVGLGATQADAEAKRHTEVYHFLFEAVVARR